MRKFYLVIIILSFYLNIYSQDTISKRNYIAVNFNAGGTNFNTPEKPSGFNRPIPVINFDLSLGNEAFIMGIDYYISKSISDKSITTFDNRAILHFGKNFYFSQGSLFSLSSGVAVGFGDYPAQVLNNNNSGSMYIDGKRDYTEVGISIMGLLRVAITKHIGLVIKGHLIFNSKLNINEGVFCGFSFGSF